MADSTTYAGVQVQGLTLEKLVRLTSIAHNVQTYGAVGDGTTDDTAAIQAAINAAEIDHGDVVLPYGQSGQYKLSDELIVGAPIGIVGRSQVKPQLFQTDNTKNTIRFTTSTHAIRARGFNVNYQNGGGTGIGIKFDDSHRNCLLENINIANSGIGVSSRQLYLSELRNIHVSNPTQMAYSLDGRRADNSSAGTTLILVNCFGNGGGFLINAYKDITLIGCAADNIDQTSKATEADGAILLSQVVANITTLGMHFESNTINAGRGCVETFGADSLVTLTGAAFLTNDGGSRFNAALVVGNIAAGDCRFVLIACKSESSAGGLDLYVQEGTPGGTMYISETACNFDVTGLGVSAPAMYTERGTTRHLPNSAWLTWRNAANSGWEQILGLDQNNDAILRAPTGEQITLRLGGTNRAYLTNAALVLAGIPIQRDGIQVLASRQAGWHPPTGTAARTPFDTSTATTQELAEHLKALIDDLTTHGLIGPAVGSGVDRTRAADSATSIKI